MTEKARESEEAQDGAGVERTDTVVYDGICPVCGEEFTDGFDDLEVGESIEGVRLCVLETNQEDQTGNALFHLPEDHD